MLAIVQADQAAYPSGEHAYHPHEQYPEYPWSERDISPDVNDTYALVRKALAGMALDNENFGLPSWNPLGEYIQPGQTVLIKPNWVSHYNKNKQVHDHLQCLVTHPSVVRAVLDYVWIALKGTGRIILGDAPMQGTDLEAVFGIAGYPSLFAFIESKGLPIEIKDFRKYHTTEYDGKFTEPQMTADSPGSITVDLSSLSAFSALDAADPLYKVSDYTMEHTRDYHRARFHEYEVSKALLDADVIINLPKPKCHKLAGLTGAMKNFVGIVYDKACLPHHRPGAKGSGMGDAYRTASFWKTAMETVNEKKTAASLSGHMKQTAFYLFLEKVFYVFGAVLKNDKTRIGAWYGNDTIWRTVIDLNRVVIFCGKDGKICDTPQRTVLTIGDSIIAGENDGPIGPTPKPLGIICISDNVAQFDLVMCEIMGFRRECIPTLREDMLSVFLQACNRHINVFTENGEYSVDSENDLMIPPAWHFAPHSKWKGHIEK